MSARPRLLDLYCGAGGAARGYHDAGFDVVGVDLHPQPDYPYEFIQEDALRCVRHWMLFGDFGMGRRFDAIHASPPCQRYTAMSTMWNHKGDAHPDLVAPTRDLLQLSGLPWVIENVPGAPMTHSIMLCGTMFGLGIEGHGGRELRRHRLFETSFPMLGPECQHQRATNRPVRRPRTRLQAHIGEPWRRLPRSRQDRARPRGDGDAVGDEVARPVGGDPAGVHTLHRRGAPTSAGRPEGRTAAARSAARHREPQAGGRVVQSGLPIGRMAHNERHTRGASKPRKRGAPLNGGK